MDIPSKHPEQTLTLTEPHRIVRRTLKAPRWSRALPLRRLSIFGAGLIAALGLPVFALASQQDNDSETNSAASHTTVNSNEPSPPNGEGFSTTTVNSSSNPPESPAVKLTVDGVPLPTQDTPSTQSYTVTSNDNTLDVSVSIDNSSSSGDTSNTSTEIVVDSYSSSEDASNINRGSPRR